MLSPICLHGNTYTEKKTCDRLTTGATVPKNVLVHGVLTQVEVKGFYTYRSESYASQS